MPSNQPCTETTWFPLVAAGAVCAPLIYRRPLREVCSSNSRLTVLFYILQALFIFHVYSDACESLTSVYSGSFISTHEHMIHVGLESTDQSAVNIYELHPRNASCCSTGNGYDGEEKRSLVVAFLVKIVSLAEGYKQSIQISCSLRFSFMHLHDCNTTCRPHFVQISICKAMWLVIDCNNALKIIMFNVFSCLLFSADLWMTGALSSLRPETCPSHPKSSEVRRILQVTHFHTQICLTQHCGL